MTEASACPDTIVIVAFADRHGMQFFLEPTLVEAAAPPNFLHWPAAKTRLNIGDCSTAYTPQPDQRTRRLCQRTPRLTARKRHMRWCVAVQGDGATRCGPTIHRRPRAQTMRYTDLPACITVQATGRRTIAGCRSANPARRVLAAAMLPPTRFVAVVPACDAAAVRNSTAPASR